MPYQVLRKSLALLRWSGDLHDRRLEHGFNAGAAHHVDEFIDGQRLRSINSIIGSSACPLRQRVRSFRADALDAPLVPEPTYSAYTQFIGITQHDLYHSGQVALLRRALGLRARD